MKNTSFLDHVKCMIQGCEEVTENPIEIREEENPMENEVNGFHPFDIDEVFAN